MELADSFAELVAETLSDTVQVEAVGVAVTDTLAEVKALTRIDTVADVMAEALVNALAETMAD